MNILVIPDTQVRPGDDLNFLRNIGKYIVEKKPDVVVHLGDHWDMPSLSSYDFGKMKFEGRRYKDDIEAGNLGMDALWTPLLEYNIGQHRNKKARYTPRKIFLKGNHENRINRAVNDDAKIEGVIGHKDLYLDDFTEVYEFLDVAVVGGVAFSHYFVTGVAGRPASSAQAQLNKKHMSCIAGHQQGFQVATARRADNKKITSIIAGSCYEHNEDYLGPQANHHDRGVVMLYDVEDGEFEHNFITLKFLNNKYAV